MKDLRLLSAYQIRWQVLVEAGYMINLKSEMETRGLHGKIDLFIAGEM